MQIVDSWIRDIPQQFQGRTNIEALITAFANQLQEVNQVLEDLNTKTGLDTATGVNLDCVGDILSLTRKEAGELLDSTYEEEVLSDDKYRQFLRYKNLSNTNECTYYDLMEGIALLWDVSPVYYIEDPTFPATIILTTPFLTPGGEVIRLGEVPMIKPAGVRIEFQYLVRIVCEVLSKWIYSVYGVPLCNQMLCGQYPTTGTLGETMYVETNANTEDIQKIFELEKSGTVRVGGSAYSSTTGKIITDDVEIAINSDYQIEEVIIAGEVIAGTHPFSAVNGIMIGSSIEAVSVITNAAAILPLSGSLSSGGGETEASSTLEVISSTSMEPRIQISTSTIVKCGSKVCG